MAILTEAEKQAIIDDLNTLPADKAVEKIVFRRIVEDAVIENYYNGGGLGALQTRLKALVINRKDDR